MRAAAAAIHHLSVRSTDFAGTRGNGEVAPEADLSGTARVSAGVDPKLGLPNAVRHHAGFDA